MFFFKQKTAYEMRISDWSSDVCSSDRDLERERSRDREALDAHAERRIGQRSGRAARGTRGIGAERLGLDRRGFLSGALERSFEGQRTGECNAGDRRKKRRAKEQSHGKLLIGGSGRQDRKSTRLNSSH